MFKLHNALIATDDPFSLVNDLSNRAFGLWSKMGLWSALEGLDGHLPNSALEALDATDEDIQELLDAELLAVNGGHFFIPDWERNQRTAAQVAKAAEQSRARMAKHRAKKSTGNDETVVVAAPKAPEASPEVVEAPKPLETILTPSEDEVEIQNSTEPETETETVADDEPAVEEDETQYSVEALEKLLHDSDTKVEEPKLPVVERTDEERQLHELEKNYPRKTDNGSRLLTALRRASLKHDVYAIIVAAQQLAERDRGVDEMEFSPLKDWLKEQEYLEEAVFDHLFDK